LEDDTKAIRTAIWESTDKQYKSALEQYTKVRTNQQVMVEQEDTSADFSVEKPNTYIWCDSAAKIAIRRPGRKGFGIERHFQRLSVCGEIKRSDFADE